MFYVYAIQSAVTSRVYVGQTRDMTARLAAHNAGSVRSTKQDRPWRLLKADSCETREAARWLEFSLKSSLGRRETWLGH